MGLARVLTESRDLYAIPLTTHDLLGDFPLTSPHIRDQDHSQALVDHHLHRSLARVLDRD